MVQSMLEFFLLWSGQNVDPSQFFNYGCWCQIGENNEFYGSRKGKMFKIISDHIFSMLNGAFE